MVSCFQTAERGTDVFVLARVVDRSAASQCGADQCAMTYTFGRRKEDLSGRKPMDVEFRSHYRSPPQILR